MHKVRVEEAVHVPENIERGYPLSEYTAWWNCRGCDSGIGVGKTAEEAVRSATARATRHAQGKPTADVHYSDRYAV